MKQSHSLSALLFSIVHQLGVLWVKMCCEIPRFGSPKNQMEVSILVLKGIVHSKLKFWKFQNQYLFLMSIEHKPCSFNEIVFFKLHNKKRYMESIIKIGPHAGFQIFPSCRSLLSEKHTNIYIIILWSELFTREPDRVSESYGSILLKLLKAVGTISTDFL